MTKFKAQFFPFFDFNTPEKLEKIAKSLIGKPICIMNWFPVEVGDVIDAYVEDGKIWYEAEIRGSLGKAKKNGG